MFSKETSPDKNRHQKPLSFIWPLLGVITVCLVLITAWWAKSPSNSAGQVLTPTARPTFTPTPALPVEPLRSASTMEPTSSRPTPTSTWVIPLEVYYTATVPATKGTTPQANDQANGMAHLQTLPQPTAVVQPAPTISYNRESRLVLAHYFAWYDDQGWDDCNISAGDKPREPYHSDDPLAIARHIQMALDVGLNGFALHWFAPGDRTDRNFETLLARSEGLDFSATIVFSRHIWHGRPAPSSQTISQALRYVLDHHAGHPNFLRLNDKPVIFFIDVYRVPTPTGQTPPQFWTAIREEVDPQRQTWWIAEGLDASYLSVFDGLYVFKISHAAQLHDYVKSPHWAAQVRAWERQTNRPKLWMATISPGWDDLRAGCKPDVRVPNTPHRLDRADGAVYEATFRYALQSNPDWLLVSSFNEWVEGSYIEPSTLYGDRYMQMTREFVRHFRDQ